MCFFDPLFLIPIWLFFLPPIYIIVINVSAKIKAQLKCGQILKWSYTNICWKYLGQKESNKLIGVYIYIRKFNSRWELQYCEENYKLKKDICKEIMHEYNVTIKGKIKGKLETGNPKQPLFFKKCNDKYFIIKSNVLREH